MDIDPEKPELVLVINPGSTSTKLAVFADKAVSGSAHRVVPQATTTLTHSAVKLEVYGKIVDQLPFRLNAIRTFMSSSAFEGSISAVIGRGGLLAPLSGGVYPVNDLMLKDLKSARYGEHASNLGAIIASELAGEYLCPAYIADPVVVDEMMDEARISGMPGIERRSIFHALNQKSVARSVAAEIGKDYVDCRFIVAHMGGGVSVGAHIGGRVIDVNNALDGEGPFSPERAGGLPVGQLMELLLSGCTSETADGCLPGGVFHKSMKKRLVGRGGMVAYLGSNDMKQVEELASKITASGSGMADAREAEQAQKADVLFRAMMHQISKEVAGHGATLRGRIDGIILTGGMAHSKRVIEELSSRLSWMAPVFSRPGEGEMEALAENAFSVLRGERSVLSYDGSGL